MKHFVTVIVVLSFCLLHTHQALAQESSSLKIQPIVLDQDYMVWTQGRQQETGKKSFEYLSIDFAEALKLLKGNVWIDMNIWLPPPPNVPEAMVPKYIAALKPLFSEMFNYCDSKRGDVFLNDVIHDASQSAEGVLLNMFKTVLPEKELETVPACIHIVSASIQLLEKEINLLKTDATRDHIVTRALGINWIKINDHLKKKEVSESDFETLKSFRIEIIHDDQKSYYQYLPVKPDAELFSNYGQMDHAEGAATSLHTFLTDHKESTADLTIFAPQSTRTDAKVIYDGTNEITVPGYFIAVLAIRTVEALLKK